MNSDLSRPSAATRRKRLLTRILLLLLAATCIGATLHQSARFINRNRPAGFGTGVIQGVLMPLALPNLAIGEDVNIYSSNNTGRGYKLGYTAGVNLCGLVFFGLSFWRVRRWRQQEAVA